MTSKSFLTERSPPLSARRIIVEEELSDVIPLVSASSSPLHQSRRPHAQSISKRSNPNISSSHPAITGSSNSNNIHNNNPRPHRALFHSSAAIEELLETVIEHSPPPVPATARNRARNSISHSLLSEHNNAALTANSKNLDASSHNTSGSVSDGLFSKGRSSKKSSAALDAQELVEELAPMEEELDDSSQNARGTLTSKLFANLFEWQRKKAEEEEAARQKKLLHEKQLLEETAASLSALDENASLDAENDEFAGMDEFERLEAMRKRKWLLFGKRKKIYTQNQSPDTLRLANNDDHNIIPLNPDRVKKPIYTAQTWGASATTDGGPKKNLLMNRKTYDSNKKSNEKQFEESCSKSILTMSHPDVSKVKINVLNNNKNSKQQPPTSPIVVVVAAAPNISTKPQHLMPQPPPPASTADGRNIDPNQNPKERKPFVPRGGGRNRLAQSTLPLPAPELPQEPLVVEMPLQKQQSNIGNNFVNHNNNSMVHKPVSVRITSTTGKLTIPFPRSCKEIKKLNHRGTEHLEAVTEDVLKKIGK